VSQAAEQRANALLRRALSHWQLWVVAGMAGGAVALWAPPGPMAPVVIASAVALVPLALIDIETHRLPNALVGGLGGITVVSMLVIGFATGSPYRLASSLFGGLALGLCYVAPALLSPGAMGGGDVKLAAVLGLTAGWFGVNAWLWLLVTPFVIGGVLGAVGLASRRLTWTAALPFGPALALGYVVASTCGF